MNRREFVWAGAAAAGAAVAGTAAAGPVVSGAADVIGTRPASAVRAAPSGFYKVVVDGRFAASRAMAAALPASVAAAVGAGGDVTRLWFDDLAHRWGAGGIVVAGMTTRTTLFCLEQLAKDHWRRVVMRIEHQSLGEGRIQHRITSCAEDAAAAAGRFPASSGWPEAAAAMLAGCRADSRAALVTRTFAGRATEARMQCPETLVSWVIA